MRSNCSSTPLMPCAVDYCPPNLRVALYRALALAPALQVTDTTANLGGRTGIALGMDTDGTRHNIIDQTTGQFIGEREVNTQNRGRIA